MLADLNDPSESIRKAGDFVFLWPSSGKDSVIHQHFINLIVLDSTTLLSSMYTDRKYVNFYLMVFRWISEGEILSNSVWAYDVCFSRSSCRKVAMPDYFTTDPKGIHAVVEHLSKVRRNFQDDKLLIAPEYVVWTSWSEWVRRIRTPLRHQNSPRKNLWYSGSVMMTLAMRHNFTFDTAEVNMEEGGIDTLSFVEGYEHDPFRLSLYKYMHLGTLMSSDLHFPSPVEMSSLRMPLELNASVILLSLALVLVVLFTVDREVVDRDALLLIVISPFCSQYMDVKFGASRRLKRVRIFWLPFASFVAILYTTLLQSYAVAPQTRVSGLTFIEMVDLKFRFLGRWSQIYKEHAQHNKETLNDKAARATMTSAQLELLRQEMILGERMKAVSFTNSDPDLGFELLEFSQRNRKVFVGDNREMGRYAEVLKTLGRNAIVGRKRFFRKQHYWQFLCEKPRMLMQSLELMKATGLVYDFAQKADKSFAAIVVAGVLINMGLENSTEAWKGVISNSIAGEIIFLFIVGILLSFFVGSTIEPAIAARTRRRPKVCNVTVKPERLNDG